MQEKTKKILKVVGIGTVFVAGAALGIKGYTKLIERSAGECRVIITNDDLLPGMRIAAKKFGKEIGQYRFVFRTREYAKEFIKEFTKCLEHCEEVAAKNG